MGLKEGDLILAADFIAIKARVKAECARRKYNGSVASYAGSSYDYTVTPQEGNVPLAEHFNKIITPLNAITDTGRTTTGNGYRVREIYDVEQKLTALEAIEITAASSGCKSSCTGLCQGTCTTGCTGCTSTCGSSCGSSCNVACSVGCWNACYEDCAAGCYSSCDRNCSPTCATNCYNTCFGTCEGGCSLLCKGTCTGANDVNPYQ